MNMSKIIKVNMMIIILSSLLFSFIDHFNSSSGSYRGLTSMMLFCGLIAFQSFVNIVLGIISLLKKDGNAKSYFLSMLIVLLIGVPLCFGGTFLF